MLTSFVRTLVPLLAAIVGPWCTNYLGWTDVQITAVLSAVIYAIAYYTTARFGERYVHPKIGLLLGIPKQPVYDYGDHDARRPTGPTARTTTLERGASTTTVAITMGVLVAASMTFALASAYTAYAAPRPAIYRTPVHADITGVHICDGAIWVTYNLSRQVGRQMTTVLDDGSERFELLVKGGRYGPKGQEWQRVTADRRSEGVLGWTGYTAKLRRGTYYEQARVIRADKDQVVSLPEPIFDGCAP